MLGYNGESKFAKKGNGVIITAPAIDPGNIPCRYAWCIK